MNSTENQDVKITDQPATQTTGNVPAKKRKGIYERLTEGQKAMNESFGIKVVAANKPVFTVVVDGVEVNVSKKPTKVDVGENSITIDF